MNPVVKMFLDALLKYLQEHPEDVKRLVELIFDAIIKAIEANNSAVVTKK